MIEVAPEEKKDAGPRTSHAASIKLARAPARSVSWCGTRFNGWLGRGTALRRYTPIIGFFFFPPLLVATKPPVNLRRVWPRHSVAPGPPRRTTLGSSACCEGG